MKSTIYCSLLLILTASSNARPGTKCGDRPADVVFVLDASSSIWPPDFERQLKFVEKVVDQFTVGFGSDETRVGLVTFSDEAHVQFFLNQYGEKDTIKRAISGVRHLQGQTNTGDALLMTRKLMFNPKYGGRSDGVHVAIVITDGESTDPRATLREATAAKDAGIQVMAIGVGKHLDMLELYEIASSPASQNALLVDNYTTLDSVFSKLTEKACKMSTVAPTSETTTTLFPTTTETSGSTTAITTTITTERESTPSIVASTETRRTTAALTEGPPTPQTRVSTDSPARETTIAHSSTTSSTSTTAADQTLPVGRVQ